MSDIPCEPLSEDEQANTHYRAGERQRFRKTFVVIRQVIGVAIVSWLLVSCAAEPPATRNIKDSPYYQLGQQKGKRDAEYLKEYNDFLQAEVKAGRLLPAQADQMFRQEQRQIKGLHCASTQIGPFTDLDCR